MTTKAQYEARLEQAKLRADRYRKEAMEHLEAIPSLDHDDAIASIEVIRGDLNEIVFYLDFIQTVTRITARKG